MKGKQLTQRALLLMMALTAIGSWWLAQSVAVPREHGGPTVKLPAPIRQSQVSIEEAMSRRRSVREYRGDVMAFAQLGQLLWASQGQTSPLGYRTAPSAGALYPLETYAVVGRVEGLDQGVYRYEPAGHALTEVAKGDKRRALAVASAGQMWMADAPVMIVLSAVYERTTGKYGRRGVRYADMEAGHAGQNVALQAVALGLGATTVGAFEDEKVKAIMGMKKAETPLYILPVGRL